MKIIGIDPGLNGGIAKMYTDSVFTVMPMPTIPSGKKGGHVLDLCTIVSILYSNECHHGESRAYIEKATAMPK